MQQSSKHKNSNDLSHSQVLVSHRVPTDTCQNDSDLAAVIGCWDRLPEAIRAGIVAMVKAALQSANT
jgi:hypothetical protein